MSILRFAIPGEPDGEILEADASLALYAVECVYGRPRVRLEVRYRVSADGVSCTIESSGESGEAAARILAGLLATRFGETGYSAERLEPAEAGR